MEQQNEGKRERDGEKERRREHETEKGRDGRKRKDNKTEREKGRESEREIPTSVGQNLQPTSLSLQGPPT
jgi:hypothetical protein